MDNKFLLPINEYPEINCYSHHANALAVARNPEIAKCVDAIFESYSHNFEELSRGISSHFNSADLAFSGDTILVDMHVDSGHDGKLCYWYQKVTGDGNCSVKVVFQKYVHNWAEAGLLITRELPTTFLEEDPNAARIILNRLPSVVVYGRTEKGDRLCFDQESLDYPVWFKITKCGNQVQPAYSRDGRTWKQTQSFSLNFGEQFYIGLLVRPMTDTFYPWFYTNHMQIHCQQEFYPWESGVPIDYFYGHPINLKFDTTLPYLKQRAMARDMLPNDQAICEVLIHAIRQGYYVECALDEQYVPDTKAFNKYHYDHKSLFFGYDQEQSEFHLMGYNQNGYYLHKTLPFDTVERAYRSADRSWDIIFLRPFAPDRSYEFNIPLFTQLVSDYLEGYDTVSRYAFNPQGPERIYGIKTYDKIIEKMERVLDDVRVFHFILEHKKIMLSRLEFMKWMDIFSQQEYESLKLSYETMEQKMRILQNLQLHYLVHPDSQQVDKIKTKLQQVRNLDQLATEQLLHCLQVYLRRQINCDGER